MDAFGLSFPLAFCDDYALLEAFSYVFFRSIHVSDFYWCCAFSLTDFCLLDCFSINLHLIFSDRVQGIKIPCTWSSLHALLPPRDSDTSQSLDSEQWTSMFQFIHFIMAGSNFGEWEDPCWQVCWEREFGSWRRWGESPMKKSNCQGDGVWYCCCPRLSYDLAGLVVSLSHEDVGWMPRPYFSNCFGKGSSCPSTYLILRVHQALP